MMEKMISMEAMDKLGLNMRQFAYLLYRCYVPSVSDLQYLEKNGYIEDGLFGHVLTCSGKNAVSGTLVDAGSCDAWSVIPSLAREMQELYPAGKRANSTQYWRGSLSEIEKRLEGFFKRFGVHDPVVVKDATRRYVKSHADDKRYMQLLKYFIYKQGSDGMMTSTLLAYIENAGDEPVQDCFKQLL
jgi:hypothetical protein